VSLARAGARVGIMDADVYGPSVPLLMGIGGEPGVANDKLVPPEAYGVKVMSIGFFSGETEAVVWRGPMLHGVVKQFLEQVEWGELDYLLIDLPPGTGDIQLSLCQMLCFTGAVIVSTPQDAALKVARKAISMFQRLDRPILGIVENMSYFTCPHCGKREDIFGHGGAKAAAEAMGMPFLGEIPLATAVRAASDTGRPVVVAEPGTPLAKAFDAVAFAVASTASIRAASGG
jgi:ATP-binding protein involved in chromosome partitioning